VPGVVRVFFSLPFMPDGQSGAGYMRGMPLSAAAPTGALRPVQAGGEGIGCSVKLPAQEPGEREALRKG